MGTLRELHPNPRFTKYLVEIMTFKNDPFVVVDVGARKGFEKHWDHYGDQIKLLGFEPNEDSFKECVRRKSNNQTTYYPYALDRIKSERDFYITAYPSSSGFYRPDLKCISKFGMEEVNKIIDTIKIKTIDLDSFQRDNQISPIDFIKLDTEGSELDILKGGEKSLIAEVLGLSIETEFLKTHIGQPLFSDIDQYLRSIGFQLYDLDLNRWSRKVLKSIDNSFGQLHFAQSLYLRDAVDELENLKVGNRNWNEIRILKMASIMELFNLPDCAIELIQKSQSLNLFKYKEIDYLINLLVPKVDGEIGTYSNYLYNLRVEKPKIQYAKKRKIAITLERLPWPIKKIIRHVLLKVRDIVNLFL